MERERRANLPMDQVGERAGAGYGMNSLEALAMAVTGMTSFTDSLVDGVYAICRERGRMDADGRATGTAAAAGAAP